MLIDLSQKLPPLTAEETYAAFLNSLRFREGFGIVFLDCSPGEADRLIPRVKQDLPEKNIKVLDLVEPINNLYRLVEGRADRASLNVLFVRGLEKSLEDDIKPGYQGLGDYYNLNTVPPILSHLNQQRENFRDHFGNICFVFVLPRFAIRYFVRRAPDFYDWNSGVFEFEKLYIEPIKDYATIFAHTETWYQKIFSYFSDLWPKFKNPKPVQDNSFITFFTKGNSLYNLGRYEEAIESYDRAISFKHDLHEAWYNRGVSLGNLGRYEEEIESYDRAISFKHDLHEAWSNRGNSLGNLGRYEEAIESYDRAISFKHDKPEAWGGRAIALRKLGRYSEAFDSYDQAIAIQPHEPQYFHNKGFAYFKQGRYPESINCFNQAIAIKFDKYDSWHDKGLVYFVLSDYLATIDSWQQAFKYISDPIVPRYHEDISGLIQEFIEELIPRFTQPSIHQTLLIPLLEIYQQANVITELGAALVNTLHLIVAPTISDHTAAEWLLLWRTSSLGNEPAMELPLRLMSTAIEYKKDPSKRQRLWLNLPSEERPILDKALKLAD